MAACSPGAIRPSARATTSTSRYIRPTTCFSPETPCFRGISHLRRRITLLFPAALRTRREHDDLGHERDADAADQERVPPTRVCRPRPLEQLRAPRTPTAASSCGCISSTTQNSTFAIRGSLRSGTMSARATTARCLEQIARSVASSTLDAMPSGRRTIVVVDHDGPRRGVRGTRDVMARRRTVGKNSCAFRGSCVSQGSPEHVTPRGRSISCRHGRTAAHTSAGRARPMRSPVSAWCPFYAR